MEATDNTAITITCEKKGAFTPAEIFQEFNAKYLDEDCCRCFVIGKIYQDNFYCPECGNSIPDNLMRSFLNLKRIKCDRCGKYFTALTGTFLSGTHFDFREIVLLAFMLAMGIEDKQIAATLKISAESVRLWRHRFAALEQSKKISGENHGN